MKNCSGCQHMRMKIPLVDSERIKRKLDYKNAVARCIRGHFLDELGKPKSFRLYSWCENPKAWVQANLCEDYTEADVVTEIIDLICKANGLGNL